MINFIVESWTVGRCDRTLLHEFGAFVPVFIVGVVILLAVAWVAKR